MRVNKLITNAFVYLKSASVILVKHKIRFQLIPEKRKWQLKGKISKGEKHQ